MTKSGTKAMIRMATAMGMAGLALAVAGCSSTRAPEEPSIYSATMARPIPADVYPVIEGKRPAANAQMSNEEAATLSARLSALGSARASGRISEAEYQRRLKELRLLASNHSSDTLKQIQNEN